MFRLLQATVSRKVVQKLNGEITEKQLFAFIAGINNALFSYDKHFNYSETESADSFGITDGGIEVVTEYRNEAEQSMFNEGKELVNKMIKNS